MVFDAGPAIRRVSPVVKAVPPAAVVYQLVISDPGLVATARTESPAQILREVGTIAGDEGFATGLIVIAVRVGLAHPFLPASA